MFGRRLRLRALTVSAVVGLGVCSGALEAHAEKLPISLLDEGRASVGPEIEPREAWRGVQTARSWKDENGKAHMRSLVWSSWGSATTTGLGISEWQGSLFDNPATPVVVHLSGLSTCGGQRYYAKWEILAQAPAVLPDPLPKAGLSGVSPCVITGLVRGNVRTSNAPTSFERKADCAWSAFRAPSGAAYRKLGMCRLQWSGWGSDRAIGRGVARDGRREWPIKVELTGLKWCRRSAITYTVARGTTYGEPTVLTAASGGVTEREAQQLRRRIDAKGQTRRVYSESRRGCTNF